jgi:hypothetical protein
MRVCPDGKDADAGIGTLRTAGHACRVAVGPPAAGGELEADVDDGGVDGELHDPGGGRPNILSEGRHPCWVRTRKIKLGRLRAVTVATTARCLFSSWKGKVSCPMGVDPCLSLCPISTPCSWPVPSLSP